jgi:uncharacterized protein (TIGR03067 family)
VTQDVARKDSPKTDLDRLQGIWSVVSAEMGGKPTKFEKAVFMVDGKRACWQTSEIENQGGLYLDPAGKPKAYDFVTSQRTVEGIYALDGDTLRLCQATKRPVEFATQKDGEQVLFVLRRIHGPEVFPYRLRDGTRAFPPVIQREKKGAPPPPPPPQPAPLPQNGNSYGTSSTKEQPSAPKEQQKDFPVQATEGKRFTIPVEQYGAIYDKTLGVLSDHFKIEYSNRFEGRIETLPAFVTPDPEGERTPSLRRRGVASITRMPEGGYLVQVIIHRERRVVSPTAPVKWEAAGRDRELERKLLAQIEKGEPDMGGSAASGPRLLQPIGPTTVTVPNARIVIAPGEKISLKPVKTANGGRVRLETAGITIEAPRLSIESNGKSTHLEASEAGDSLITRSSSARESTTPFADPSDKANRP